jgi:hypothetical protein
LTDTDLNLRFNTLMIVHLMSVIMSWVTPYPWWQDVLIIGAIGTGVSLDVAWKQ